MANYNLTSQQIKDTYEQLVQVSGSALVDGTGSAVSVTVDSASFATTASFAQSALAVDTQWNDILNKPSGLVSGSSQIDLGQATGTALNATNAVNATNATNATTADSATTATTATNATNATNADNIALSEDGTNTNRRVTFTATANGDGTLLTDAGLLYNPSSNTITTTRVVADVTGDVTGDLVGNVTGNVSGTAGSATSASYATNADTLDGFNSDAFPRLQIDNSFYLFKKIIKF